MNEMKCSERCKFTEQELCNFFTNYTDLQFVKSSCVDDEDYYGKHVNYEIIVVLNSKKYFINFSILDEEKNGIYLINFKTNLKRETYFYNFEDHTEEYFVSYGGFFSRNKLRDFIYRHNNMKSINFIKNQIELIKLKKELALLRDEKLVMEGYAKYTDTSKSMPKIIRKINSVKRSIKKVKKELEEI